MALTMLKTITVTLKYTKDETQNRFLGVMEEKQFLNALKKSHAQTTASVPYAPSC